jgi:hypothetical protein
MARSTQLPPGIGHNHRDLSDDELGALVTSFTTRVIDLTRREEAAAAVLKGIRKEKSGLYKLIKKETDYDRDEFEEEVVANLDRSEDEIRAEQARRTKLQFLAGLREGEQLDLLEMAQADTVDDAIAAEAAGYRAGRRADEYVRPDTIDSYFEQDWMRGYTRGQEVNAKAEAMAAEILARPKPGVMVAADDEAPKPLPEPGTPEHDAALRESERLARESLGMQPTAAEQAFEEADNGRTIRAA